MTPVVLKIESKIRSLIRSRIETSFRTAPRLDYEFDVEKRKSVLGSVRHCKAVRLSDLFRDMMYICGDTRVTCCGSASEIVNVQSR
jgi:hypothetical protein